MQQTVNPVRIHLNEFFVLKLRYGMVGWVGGWGADSLISYRTILTTLCGSLGENRHYANETA